MSSKIVHKPWGKEVWLELNDRYCYKRIYINAGTKTSYQYHENKLETNFIIEGEAEVWLENDDGIVEKSVMSSGDYFTVIPPRKHRVIALTDVILQEVSTPEVDDVIRISDDSQRGDGKLDYEHQNPAFCILAAGLGSRLGDVTEYINKALCPLDNKAVISHLIDKVSSDYDIVIALGYKGGMVREYCEAAHPDRNFIFVDVDRFEGDGSGPAYSINQCKQYLQRPFIWASVDTIVLDEYPSLNTNWLGVYPTGIPELYSTVDCDDNNNVTSFSNKSPDGYGDAFIGLAGVYDYEIFWNQLDISTTEIVSAYYDVSVYPSMKSKSFDWYDVGTLDNYTKAQSLFRGKQYCIPKVNGEFLYKVDDRFIKLSIDKSFIKNRVDRADILNGLVPEIHYSGDHVYSYKWVDGETLYTLSDISLCESFLDYAKKALWSAYDFSGDFSEVCKSFYFDKTMSRLALFLDKRESSFESSHTVNGVHTKPIHELIDNVDWSSLYDGIPTKHFHGDLQFDHVIYDGDDKYSLIDWRQDFAGIDVGDVYYDLAKMYGGILMSYDLMKDETQFSCNIDKSVVSYSYNTDITLNRFLNYYEEWIGSNGYDLDKVKLITAIIWLNMAPLHEETFGNVLFFKSKQALQEIFNNHG